MLVSKQTLTLSAFYLLEKIDLNGYLYIYLLFMLSSQRWLGLTSNGWSNVKLTVQRQGVVLFQEKFLAQL